MLVILAEKRMVGVNFYPHPLGPAFTVYASPFDLWNIFTNEFVEYFKNLLLKFKSK
ncbi:hypothetical protein NITUZ_140081 [Candidatus Nitrosotenuis uzonensis]|uniref:Uncharacterized protein n=1 Tax=Candidatus Nitrosotenuis uzonensis TaxID=1407055 RepID=V6AQJ1_9ARCH|nr:hypothetical protein NITUZ_140081 [Candidatus Nitrosotenuis uzonensis]